MVLIACSAVFYVGRLALLYFPVAGLLLSLLSVFLHNQQEQFAGSDDAGSVYIAVKSKAFQLAGILGASMLLSILYFPFLGIFPRVQTGIVDVLIALIALCVSLLILGWLIVKGEKEDKERD
ncbi:MAG: hypothetical protein QXJ27_02955 [Thermoplasmata archaeon]